MEEDGRRGCTLSDTHMDDAWEGLERRAAKDIMVKLPNNALLRVCRRTHVGLRAIRIVFVQCAGCVSVWAEDGLDDQA